jgi:hypothetical protein
MVPATAIGLKFAYDANVLATANPTSALGVAQGHHVAVAVAACAIGAGILRAALVPTVDRGLAAWHLPAAHRARVTRSAWGVLAVAVIIALIALRGSISHEYHGFVNPKAVATTDFRARLTDPSNDGRTPLWKVAWHDFKAHPIIGLGAGTFQNSWYQRRSINQVVVNAHSLYLENLDELGIVGAGLLIAFILLVLGTALVRARGPDRPVYGAIFAIGLAWAVHAGVDWDWQMPVVTIPIGGIVLARPVAADAARQFRAPSSFMRAMMGVGCLILAVTPTYMWLSQRDLTDALQAYNAGDCHLATRSAASAISLVGVRPEAYEVLSYCDVYADKPTLAITTMEKAISLDPQNWNYRVGLAIMKAAAGQNPRGSARRAIGLNPLDPDVRTEMETLTRSKSSQWSKEGFRLAQSVTFLGATPV